MDFVLSLVALTAIALVLGAIWLWRRHGVRKQAVLMVLLALVMVVNVLIWTLPDSDGAALRDRASDAGISQVAPT